ncbi:MAG TPA: hypothetical protein DCQ06_13950 [Myxococcales bacterium]|nr:hypothetical protein [Myxococcales bacterium]
MSKISCNELIHQIKGALGVIIRDAEVDIDTEDMAALSFQHPGHKATVFVFVEQGDKRQPLASLAIFVLIDDWADVQQDLAKVTKLLQLNTALMSCSIGVLQLNADEQITALCRRLPVAEVAPEDVMELVEGMIWEYANAAGFIEQAQPSEG